MLKLSTHQHAMLREMGIVLPLLNKAETTIRQPEAQVAHVQSKNSATIQASETIKDSFKKQIRLSQTAQAIPPTDAKATPEPLLPALSERSQMIAQMPWQDLAQAVEHCQACSLCKSRKHTVFGVGNPDAKWMIVGEAPGEQEDRQGEPFVGQAGKLLDKMLIQLHIARHPKQDEQAIYIANVLKCRPPRNRNPEPQEMAQCEPYLKRQIELIKPKVILAMGRFAVQALLQSHEAIGRLRGRAHSYRGIPVVVTYHPAYLLRNPVDKRKSWEDLCLAADLYEKE